MGLVEWQYYRPVICGFGYELIIQVLGRLWTARRSADSVLSPFYTTWYLKHLDPMVPSVLSSSHKRQQILRSEGSVKIQIVSVCVTILLYNLLECLWIINIGNLPVIWGGNRKMPQSSGVVSLLSQHTSSKLPWELLKIAWNFVRHQNKAVYSNNES